MKNFIFALALASLSLAGCASEEADTTDTDVMVDEAEVTTPPADDMMMADTTMADSSGMMMEEGDAMMADSTATGM